jgi:Trypsin-like peptidase domain
VKRLLVIIALAVLTGCTATPISGVGFLSSGIGVGEYATYTQWNKDYAVTVSHYTGYLDSQYQSPRLDVKFFKHTSKNGVREWADVKDGERVQMAGFIDEGSEFNIMQGRVAKEKITINNQSVYRLITGALVPGMSGGPVLNVQGQVVGINVGYSTRKIVVESQKGLYSLVLPYSEIKKEWELYQKTISP